MAKSAVSTQLGRHVDIGEWVQGKIMSTTGSALVDRRSSARLR